MTQKFQVKLQQLTKKISTIHQPCTLLQRQSKCKQHLQLIKSQLQQKKQYPNQSVQSQLAIVQERIDKYNQKIKSTKQTIKNFSLDKHSKFKQIIQDWVDQFKDSLKKAKQSLRVYEASTQVKMTEIENNNAVVINNLKDKINKNLRKANGLIESMAITMKQQREQILRQFDNKRVKIEKLFIQKSDKQKYTQKLLQDSLSQMQMRLTSKMQLSTEKWHVKDEKTQKILQIFIESKELF